jgi:hypothetical protein
MFTSFKFIIQNRKIFNGIIIFIILSRFAWLNIINWNNGELTTGTGGVQYHCDSIRYISGADNLINNTPFDDKQFQYFGYVGIIAFVKIIGLGLGAVVIIQILMALFSSWFLYDMGKSIIGNSTAGIIVAGLYLTNPFIVTWHLFILTESLYTSFLIIATWAINKSLEIRTVKFYIISFIAVCFAAFIRPNGWILFIVMFSFYILYANYNIYLKYASILVIVSVFFACTVFIPKINKSIQYAPLSSVSLPKMLTKGMVIWGHDELCIEMPQDSNLKNKNWTAYFSYIAKHPIACIKLGSYRAMTEVLQIRRPWLSVKYQIHIWLWILPAYLLATLGTFWYKNNKCIKIIITVILFHILIIALTWADHESRFYIYFLPLVYLLSGCGLYPLFKRLEKLVTARH